MKKILLIVFFSFLFIWINAQCDCEKIQRSDGVITTCKTLPVAGDDRLQIGLNLLSNGRDSFIATTIRFLANSTLKITGDMSLRLVDNNLLTFKLVKSQRSFIGKSEVEFGIFKIDENQFSKIQKSNILTITVLLSENIMYSVQALFNQDILVNQVKCLK